MFPLGCKAIGYALLVFAVVGAAFGLWALLAPGGSEADAVRVGGFELLAVAAVIGIAAVVILRSGARGA